MKIDIQNDYWGWNTFNFQSHNSNYFDMSKNERLLWDATNSIAPRLARSDVEYECEIFELSTLLQHIVETPEHCRDLILISIKLNNIYIGEAVVEFKQSDILLQLEFVYPLYPSTHYGPTPRSTILGRYGVFNWLNFHIGYLTEYYLSFEYWERQISGIEVSFSTRFTLSKSYDQSETRSSYPKCRKLNLTGQSFYDPRYAWQINSSGEMQTDLSDSEERIGLSKYNQPLFVSDLVVFEVDDHRFVGAIKKTAEAVYIYSTKELRFPFSQVTVLEVLPSKLYSLLCDRN